MKLSERELNRKGRHMNGSLFSLNGQILKLVNIIEE